MVLPSFNSKDSIGFDRYHPRSQKEDHPKSYAHPFHSLIHIVFYPRFDLSCRDGGGRVLRANLRLPALVCKPHSYFVTGSVCLGTRASRPQSDRSPVGCGRDARNLIDLPWDAGETPAFPGQTEPVSLFLSRDDFWRFL